MNRTNTADYASHANKNLAFTDSWMPFSSHSVKQSIQSVPRLRGCLTSGWLHVADGPTQKTGSIVLGPVVLDLQVAMNRCRLPAGHDDVADHFRAGLPAWTLDEVSEEVGLK